MGCQCAKRDSSTEQEITKETNKETSNTTSNNTKVEAKIEVNNRPEPPSTVVGKTDMSLTNQSMSKMSETESKRRKVDYNKEVFDLINKIRADPSGFVKDIEDAISKITNIEGKIVYKGAVKVAVKQGETAFREAAKILKGMKPLKPLELSEEIAIMVPEDEERMKSTKVFQELVEERRKTSKIDAYLKDLVKDPYTSVLLMVIDDNGKNSGKKRNVILGSEYTKMAVTSRRNKKTFCAYYTFSN